MTAVPHPRPANLLVVDDTPENLRLLVHALTGAGYRVRAAQSGKAALQMAREEPPDLVLLDVDMPELDGYAVCERLRAEVTLTRVPVLFISAIHDAQAKVKALRAGGRDYVTKPFHMEEVLMRVATHVGLHRLEGVLAQSNERLERMVAEQVREISDSQQATIVALARLAESRDDNTGLHVERIGEMSRVLLRAVEGRDFDEGLLNLIGRAATLHDIGKVAIPDAVLLKPGRLTPEEFEVMKTHAELGARTLEAVLRTYPRNELVRVGAEIARSHHEKWDGSGYPAGLAGEAIPFSARIVAVADVYDAIRARRPYKEPANHADATAIIRQGRGRHFDPRLVDAFAASEQQFDEVWLTLQSAQEQRAEKH